MNTFDINQTQITMKINDHLKFLQVIYSKQTYENTLRIRAKLLEQW